MTDPVTVRSKAMKNIRLLSCFIVCLFVFSSCAVVPTGEFPADTGSAEKRKLVLWMLSDIQPPTVPERVSFERAIADVNTNVGQVDLGVMAGDLLKSRSQDEAFRWFLATRKRSKIKDWYEIAGNHDIRSGKLFWQYFLHPSYYAVEVGNLLFLLMSDESSDSKTDLSDATFDWWRKMVIENQDHIIITVTHAQLRHSGLLGSIVPSRVIAGSERFERVLKQYTVALWASGHVHLPQGLAETVSIQKKFGDTFFINVSCIYEDTLMDSQSRFFYFKNGSDTVWIRSRNHTKERFDTGLDIPIQLDRPFVWDGGESVFLPVRDSLN